MRSMMKGLVVASAGFAMFVTPAGAAEYQDDMKEMREMVLKLQDQLEAQQSQLDQQEGVIREAGLEEERGTASELSSFLESTDFSGWVSASYFYNFNNPRQPSAGANATFDNPFHADHNSFQFDEAWFTIDRGATEEMPAGFHFEAVYGATATAFVPGHGGGNDLWIPAANVSYLTPWGQTVTAGKFGTTIGYEVAGAPSNVNITRGITYNLFQPVSHLGATLSQDFDSGMTYTVGIVNGFGTNQPDANGGKGFLWQVGWGNDMVTLLFNGIIEENTAGPGHEQVVLDFVAEMTPADNVLLWTNLDYIMTNRDGSSNGRGDASGVGISVGGRVGVTDDMGIGARGEYAAFDQGSSQNGALDDDIWTITGTLDYALTENLSWKGEVKYEGANGSNEIFPKGRNSSGRASKDVDDAVFVGTQLYYEF
jgi:hypothetical protein